MDEDTADAMLSVKLPMFWADKPEAWFVQTEVNFRARRISSKKAQFNLVVVAVDADTINGVIDLLKQPPDEDAYDLLKARLLQAFKLPTVEKIKRALELP